MAMHNRMLQLCLPTAVDAVSPDAAIMLMHALGVGILPTAAAREPSCLRACVPSCLCACHDRVPTAMLHCVHTPFAPMQAYLKATVSSCPEASMPSSGGRPLHGAHLPPPQPFLHAGRAADEEPEWEALETEGELHDRVAREQVASAHAQAQARLQMRKRQDGHATNTSRLRPSFAVVPVQNGDLVACVAQRQEQRLKRKRERGQAQGPKINNGRRRLIEIRLEAK
eukprot:COSAG03_NODE_1782_length_3530_cov_2.946817_5_plen_225_part_01